MKLSYLSERDERGKQVDPAKLGSVYHLTDYRGFSYSVSQNSLNAFRQSGVSTTTNPNLNAIGGRDLYHFKFVLDGASLAEKYPAHVYRSHFQYVGGLENGKSTGEWNEAEIRYDTSAITPLDAYTTGLEILVPIYSRSFIQWMFYRISASKPIFDREQAAAPRGIESLMTVEHTWKAPLFVWDQEKTRRPLNPEEKKFVDYCYDIRDIDAPFEDILDHLVDRFYGIRGHFNDLITPDIRGRAKHTDEIVAQINKLAEVPRNKIDGAGVRKWVTKWLNTLGYGHNSAAHILQMLDENEFFTWVTPPVVWANVFRMLIQGEVDDLIDYIPREGARFKRSMEWAASYPDQLDYSHDKTMMSR